MVNILIILLSAILNAFGLGGGNLYLLYSTNFCGIAQKAAQGKNLFLYIPCALFSVLLYAYKKVLSFSLIFPVILGGIVGTLLGAGLLNVVPTKYLRLVFACFLLFQGGKILFSKK